VRIGRVIGLVVAAGFVGFVVYSLLWSEPVKILHPRLEHSADGGFVTGSLENTGSGEESVNLEIRYYDGSGHQIASDIVKLDKIDTGATRNFSSPLRRLPADASYSIYMNHGRNPYGN